MSRKLTPGEIINLREVLSTGIFNKTLNRLWNAAGGDGAIETKEAQIQLLKVLYGQASHMYNTSVGSLITQLATISYIDASNTRPTDFIVDPAKETGPEFSAISQDTLLVRRLMMQAVVVPDLSAEINAQAKQFADFTAQISTTLAEKQQAQISKLLAENEKLRRQLKNEGVSNGIDEEEEIPVLEQVVEQVELVDDGDIDEI